MSATIQPRLSLHRGRGQGARRATSDRTPILEIFEGVTGVSLVTSASFSGYLLGGPDLIFLYLILGGILSALYLSWVKRRRTGGERTVLWRAVEP